MTDTGEAPAKRVKVEEELHVPLKVLQAQRTVRNRLVKKSKDFYFDDGNFYCLVSLTICLL